MWFLRWFLLDGRVCYEPLSVTDILMHPVVLNMAMKRDFVADEDVYGITLNAGLFLFLLFSAEGQSSGSAIFSRSVEVWRELLINRSLEAVGILLLGGWKITDQDVVLTIFIRKRRGGRTDYKKVEEPQQRKEEADLGKESHLPRPADLHDLAASTNNSTSQRAPDSQLTEG